jgi:type IV pilus assembly protein PilA
MPSSLSSNQLLISALAKRQRAKTPLQAGFTLIELLVVIIIIGILAALALPTFLNQADKANANSAKTMAASAGRECQAWLVDQDPATFVLTTKSTPKVALTGDTCVTGAATAGAFAATVTSKNWTYTATVDSSGAMVRTCTTGAFGCASSTPQW